MSFPTFAAGVARPAAAVAAGVFIAVAGLQLFWAAGGDWGLSAAWGGTYSHLPARLRVASALSAAVLIVGAVIVLTRAGYWASPVPFRVLRWGTWVFVVVLALSALGNLASSSNWERFLNGPIALLVALLCFIVARSAEPQRGG